MLIRAVERPEPPEVLTRSMVGYDVDEMFSVSMDCPCLENLISNTRTIGVECAFVFSELL